MKLTLNIDTLVTEELQKAKGFIEHLLGMTPTPGSHAAAAAATIPPQPAAASAAAAPAPAPAAPAAPAPASGIPAAPTAPAPAAPAAGVTHEQVKQMVTKWLAGGGANTAAVLQGIYGECGAPNVAKATPEQLAHIAARLQPTMPAS